MYTMFVWGILRMMRVGWWGQFMRYGVYFLVILFSVSSNFSHHLRTGGDAPQSEIFPSSLLRISATSSGSGSSISGFM